VGRNINFRPHSLPHCTKKLRGWGEKLTLISGPPLPHCSKILRGWGEKLTLISGPTPSLTAPKN